jgi:hypothetical protein
VVEIFKVVFLRASQPIFLVRLGSCLNLIDTPGKEESAPIYDRLTLVLIIHFDRARGF